MNVNISEWTWLDDQEVCTAQHITEVSGLSREELDELIENGVIVPIDNRAQPQAFPLRHVVTANIARRLRDDFELDRHGMVLAVTLMQHIDALRNELNAVRAQLHQRISRRE